MPTDYTKMAEEYQREAERQEQAIARLKGLYGKVADGTINRQIATREDIMHECRAIANEMRKRAERENGG